MNYYQLLAFKTPSEIRQESIKLTNKEKNLLKTISNLSKHRNRVMEKIKVVRLFCNHLEEDGNSALIDETYIRGCYSCRYCGYYEAQDTAV